MPWGWSTRKASDNAVSGDEVMKKTKLAMMWEIDEVGRGERFVASITDGWTFCQTALSVLPMSGNSESFAARARVTISTIPELKSVARILLCLGRTS